MFAQSFVRMTPLAQLWRTTAGRLPWKRIGDDTPSTAQIFRFKTAWRCWKSDNGVRKSKVVYSSVIQEGTRSLEAEYVGRLPEPISLWDRFMRPDSGWFERPGRLNTQYSIHSSFSVVGGLIPILVSANSFIKTMAEMCVQRIRGRTVCSGANRSYWIVSYTIKRFSADWREKWSAECRERGDSITVIDVD